MLFRSSMLLSCISILPCPAILMHNAAASSKVIFLLAQRVMLYTLPFASGLVAGSTTLTESQIPSHTHGLITYGDLSYDKVYYCGASRARDGAPASAATGGGGSHNHTLPSFAVQYVDVIRASKD